LARGAEKQKNKLADNGGLTTTIVFHPPLFPAPLFSPNGFHALLFIHNSFPQPFTHRSL